MPKATSRHVRVVGPRYHPSSRSGTHASKVIEKKVIGLQAIAAEREKAQQQYNQMTTGLSMESRKVINDIRGEDTAIMMSGDYDTPPDDHPSFVTHSPAGDDDDEGWIDESDESISYAIRDILDARAPFRIKKDTRTWADRLHSLDENWQPLLPLLVEAYLKYAHHAEQPPVEPIGESAAIQVIDIYTMAQSAQFTICPNQRTAEALVAAGYLAASPIRPSLAIALSTLELFRCLRLVKASFSAEAFTKLICYKYCIPYRRHYRSALADAFDVYLMIREQVDQRVMAVLGRDGLDWRAKHSCPCCSYEVDGEDPPKYSRLLVMDGNNSLKRLAPVNSRRVGDARAFHSDYYLSREFVNEYAHEVKARQEQPKPDLRNHENQDADEEPGEDALQEDVEGDPTDGTSGDPSPCATNWKAAAADDKKRMWGMFDETGIFACACRHGLIVWLVDMVKSGELAKYPLAILAKVLKTLPGSMLVGYDIGCTLDGTVDRSSLAEQWKRSGSRFCVNAFHGYSHSYNCQVRYHPNIIKGIGLEDLETLERIFSSSNQLAPIVRYASPYRRMSFIHLFFRQWDHEKYSNLGLMLYNNYRQAVEIITTQPEVLKTMLGEAEHTEDELKTFDEEEAKYFSTLRDEEPENLHAIAYVEVLQQWRKAKEELADATSRFADRRPTRETASGTTTVFEINLTTGPTDYNADLSITRKLETRRRYLQERVDQLTSELTAMEVRYGIENRWETTDFLYTQAVGYMVTRRYQQALGKLQRLVIQRLFELHKLNLAQTGYKVRTYLAKNLQRRCKAIRNAVSQYNAAALALDPPRSTIDWSRVSHYTFVEEFALLHDTRNDLTNTPWARPEVREAMRLSRRIERAREEIANANREVRRLHTHIRDEESLFKNVLDRLAESCDPLHGAVQEYCRHRRAANARNMAYIEQIYTLEGFTGIPAPGRRTGSSDTDSLPPVDSDTSEQSSVNREVHDNPTIHDDDDAGDEVSNIIEYLARLST